MDQKNILYNPQPNKTKKKILIIAGVVVILAISFLVTFLILNAAGNKAYEESPEGIAKAATTLYEDGSAAENRGDIDAAITAYRGALDKYRQVNDEDAVIDMQLKVELLEQAQENNRKAVESEEPTEIKTTELVD